MRLTVNLAGKSRLCMLSNLMTSLTWRICWSFLAGCRESPHAKRYHLRYHFYKRIQRGTCVAVSFENQFDRLVSYLVTASEEHEEEYEENENRRFASSFICSRNVFDCLQGQLTVWVFDISLPFDKPFIALFRRFSAYFGISILYQCIGTTKQHMPSLHRECYRTL